MQIWIKMSISLAMIGVLVGCSLSSQSPAVKDSSIPQRDPNCQVNTQIERLAVPATPNQMSLPSFGQGVIGWATGPEGAQQRLSNVAHKDIAIFQAKSVTLDMVLEWQAFYENETKRNPCNPTAPLRAELMKKIAQLWVQ